MKFWLWVPLTMLMLSPVLWDRIENRMDGIAEGSVGTPPAYAEGSVGTPPR